MDVFFESESRFVCFSSQSAHDICRLLQWKMPVSIDIYTASAASQQQSRMALAPPLPRKCGGVRGGAGSSAMSDCYGAPRQPNQAHMFKCYCKANKQPITAKALSAWHVPWSNGDHYKRCPPVLVV